MLVIPPVAESILRPAVQLLSRNTHRGWASKPDIETRHRSDKHPCDFERGASHHGSHNSNVVRDIGHKDPRSSSQAVCWLTQRYNIIPRLATSDLRLLRQFQGPLRYRRILFEIRP